jgi:hypothetical protein
MEKLLFAFFEMTFLNVKLRMEFKINAKALGKHKILISEKLLLKIFVHIL